MPLARRRPPRNYGPGPGGGTCGADIPDVVVLADDTTTDPALSDLAA